MVAASRVMKRVRTATIVFTASLRHPTTHHWYETMLARYALDDFSMHFRDEFVAKRHRNASRPTRFAGSNISFADRSKAAFAVLAGH